MELIPLIMIEGEDSSVPEAVVIWTPATMPSRDLVTLELCTLAMSVDFTTDADPVNDSFVDVPNATTMVSSSSWVSGERVTLSTALPATGTSDER